MIRPTFEVADIFRAKGDSFIDHNETWISYQQLNVMRAVTRCRTAALGGHVDRCTRCGHQAISFNSRLMGSNSLWGVARQTSMLQRGSTPFRLPIKIWP